MIQWQVIARKKKYLSAIAKHTLNNANILTDTRTLMETE